MARAPQPYPSESQYGNAQYDPDNAATLAELHREVLRGNFRGQIVLHCDRGRICSIEIITKRRPVFRQRQERDLTCGDENRK
jgi:hypothetical protein